MRQYLDLMQLILERGTRAAGPHRHRHPFLVRRADALRSRRWLSAANDEKLHLRSIIVELLWFLRGDTNIRWLNERKVRIWDEWADESGDLGPVYGKQWRDWETPGRPPLRPDRQPRRSDPPRPLFAPADRHRLEPRRDLEDGARALPLPVPDAGRGGRLNLQLYQRSADVFLGVPFNIASYALLTHMLARECGLEPGHSSGPAAIATFTRTTSSRRGCS